MAETLVLLLGVGLIALSMADLVNTLVSTSTSYARWWPTRFIGRSLFVSVRSLARQLPEESPVRERMLSAFAPVLVIVLLATWSVLQVTGFALIWSARNGFDGISGFGDAWYYSGVVYFTVGFGEIVPSEAIGRLGALVEAFFGVTTVALVIGYLPALYTAYSDRERMLPTLDAGTAERITPTELIKAWAPDADPKKIDAQFARWEQWAAGVLETHSTVPLLAMFRSHDRRQNWVTALGLVSDAALQAQIINGATDGNGYWFLRRAEAIFREVTAGRDLGDYGHVNEVTDERVAIFDEMYQDLTDHGFSLRPKPEAVAYMRQVRPLFGPALEFLIDDLLCPRGFWALDSQVKSWSSQHEIARYDETESGQTEPGQTEPV